MTDNIYLQLTRQFNENRLRCILSSGQAVVVHRLAAMENEGEWIVREDAESLNHVLEVLEGYGAKYRLGAPLDTRWMKGGWSAHFEFASDGYRARADFVTRPPRLDPEDLRALWREHEAGIGIQEPVPTIDLRRLALLKKTNRERDYAVIGELARLQSEPRDQMLLSRSARDLMELQQQFPDLMEQLQAERPVLAKIAEGRDALEAALDAERRSLMRINEERLARYSAAVEPWQSAWPALSRRIADLPLREAHQVLVESALPLLPQAVENHAS